MTLEESLDFTDPHLTGLLEEKQFELLYKYLTDFGIDKSSVNAYY